MCGIAAIVSRTGVRSDVIRQMTDLVRHRGPDDEGYLTVAAPGAAAELYRRTSDAARCLRVRSRIFTDASDRRRRRPLRRSGARLQAALDPGSVGARPPADVHTGSALLDRLQRRDLQLSGARRRVGPAGSPVRLAQRHRSVSRRFCRVGRRVPEPPEWHVGGRDLRCRARRDRRVPRSVRDQAALLLGGAGRDGLLRVGNQTIHRHSGMARDGQHRPRAGVPRHRAHRRRRCHPVRSGVCACARWTRAGRTARRRVVRGWPARCPPLV